MHKRFESFEDFWPFYLGEHSHPLNRKLHFIGSSCAVGITATVLLTGNLWLLPLVPLSGYGFAWAGHFLVEKNRPATFSYPLWSLRGDLRMWAFTLTGRLDAELRSAGVAV